MSLPGCLCSCFFSYLRLSRPYIPSHRWFDLIGIIAATPNSGSRCVGCVVIQRPFSNVVTSVIFSEAHLVVCFSFVLIVHLKNKSTNCRFVSLVSVYIYLQYTSTLDPLQNTCVFCITIICHLYAYVCCVQSLNVFGHRFLGRTQTSWRPFCPRTSGRVRGYEKSRSNCT